MLCYPLSGSVLCRFDRTDTEGRCRAALSTAGRGQERERHPLPLALQRLFCSFASASVTAAPRPMRKDRDGTGRHGAPLWFRSLEGPAPRGRSLPPERGGPGRAGPGVRWAAGPRVTSRQLRGTQSSRAGPRRRRPLGHLPGAVAARRRGRRGAAPPGNFPPGLERAEGGKGERRAPPPPDPRPAPRSWCSAAGGAGRCWNGTERGGPVPPRRRSRLRLSALGLRPERTAKGPALGTAGLRGRGAGRGSLGGANGRVEELTRGRGWGRCIQGARGSAGEAVRCKVMFTRLVVASSRFLVCASLLCLAVGSPVTCCQPRPPAFWNTDRGQACVGL